MGIEIGACQSLLRTYFKLTNCLQIKTTDTYITIIFRVGLHPYMWLSTFIIKRKTLIEHKENVICEESGPKFYKKKFGNSNKHNGVQSNTIDSNCNNWYCTNYNM